MGNSWSARQLSAREDEELLPMVEKQKTAYEILRDDYDWPMTAGEVSKITGVTTRALQIYDEKGLLSPARSGEGVANNRKLYYPEDLERLKRIVVLKYYEFDLKDMPPILDGERDLIDALAERIEELRAAENYLRNLILFAQYASVVGEDLFETIAFGSSDVDDYAAMLRQTVLWSQREQRWQTLDDDGLERMACELGDIVERFLEVGGDDTLTSVERVVGMLRAWFCEYYFAVDDLDLLNIWVLFEDGSEEAELASEIGNESTPGFLQASVFLVWLKAMLRELSHFVEENCGEGALSENALVLLVDFVCRSAGYPVPEAVELDGEAWREMVDFFEVIATYLQLAFAREDTMDLIDPGRIAKIDGAFLEEAKSAARQLILFAQKDGS